MRYVTGYLTALAVAIGAACSSDSTGSGGGGGGCDDSGGGAINNVVVRNNLFRSAENGTCNPAVDTALVGTTITWTWTGTGGISHSVESTGSPSFTSSAILSGSGSTYSFPFNTPGTYTYQCAVHGAAMRGRVVIQ